MKPLRQLTIFPLALLCLLAFSAGSASADARTDCDAVDAEASAANLAEARNAIVCLTNRERLARGMGALRTDSVLTKVAQSHSEDMAQNNYFAHEDRSGGQPWDRAEKAGYTTGYVGENISAGYASPFAAMTGWMKSSGHCLNVLKATYTDIGIGIASNADSEYGIYWTMVLGGNDASAPKVKLSCPYSELVAGTVSGADSNGSAQSATKVKLTSVKRRKDGKYRVLGKVPSVTKATVVKLTVRRGKKAYKYSVKTKKSGSFAATVRAPGGSGKVTVSAKT
jgi:uncharacterized protein YkwD